MCDVIKECAACKQTIPIDIYNIHDVARLQALYYHTSCLKELAKKRINSKRHAACWDYAIDHINECEKDAKDTIYKRYWQDLLDKHLKSHYDIQVVNNHFWEIVMDLHNGIYKKQKCKPVHMETMYGAWVWGQKKLDSISRQNKKERKGPKSDDERLIYDLTILITKIPVYLKAKAKLEAEEAERQAREKERTRIDYNNIYIAPVKSEGLDDISALLDDF